MTLRGDSRPPVAPPAWFAAAAWVVFAILKWLTPPLFALKPNQWIDNWSAWIDFVTHYLLHIVIVASIVMFVIAVALSERSLGMRRRRRGGQVRLEYLAPEVRNHIPERVPRGVQERLMDTLETITNSDIRGLHTIRIVVMTGQHTLDYLETLIQSYATHNRWLIRLLILDPNVPAVELLAKGSRENILASINQLTEMRATAEGAQAPITLEWRAYSQLLAMRGFLIDDDHLFLGLTAWSDMDSSSRSATPRLHAQDRWLAYMTSHDELGNKAIESFRTWFDYQWKYATRDLEATA